jgi:hypothetical protein
VVHENDEQHWRAARAANARRIGSIPMLVSKQKTKGGSSCRASSAAAPLTQR